MPIYPSPPFNEGYYKPSPTLTLLDELRQGKCYFPIGSFAYRRATYEPEKQA
jgi:hypothetical protein